MYEGVRILSHPLLAQAEIRLQIDIGFGDAISPAAEEVQFPVVLEFPAPTLRAYLRETVVAEKYQAMVVLGISNSRMKDFYDLWVLARQFPFAGALLGQAIQATFERRKTPLPGGSPLALTATFHDDAIKKQQWQAFIRKSKLPPVGVDLATVAGLLRRFLLLPTEALRAGDPFTRSWTPEGPWT